jgi:hypothetical protein
VAGDRGGYISGLGRLVRYPVVESILASLVSVEDLPEGTQSELPWVLKDEVPALQRFDGDDIAASLFDPANPVPDVELGQADPVELQKQFDPLRQTSPEKVARYAGMLRENPSLEFDPVFLRHGKFLDGGHRVAAYIKAGRSQIPTVDIGPLVDVDWDDRMADE